MISASKLDAQLYPILTKQTDDLNVLRGFLEEKLRNVLSDIEKAQIEITQHIQTTSNLKPKDEKTAEKISQVLRNLNAIVDKLSLIQNEFRSLIEAIVDFIKNLSITKSKIVSYFERAPSVGAQNIEELLNENNRFTEDISNQFRNLLDQSESLIDLIRRQEPIEIKEHDIKYVMSLLDNLRLVFETENKIRVDNLRREVDTHRFRKDLNDIFQNIDQLKSQLNESQGQFRDNPAGAKATSLSFEYFEQTIQVRSAFDEEIYFTIAIKIPRNQSK